MQPELFDKKLNDLREIEQRMKNYDHKTPLTKVLNDRKAAQDIYTQLATTIKEIMPVK